MVKEITDLPEDLKKRIREDPLFFVYEGGSDGTFGNVLFHEEFGEWLPAASEYAAQECERQGFDW